MTVTAEPLRIVVEIDRGADTIVGRCRDERGGERPFSGWLGLIAALERALEATGGDAAWPRAHDAGNRPR